jgi:hypothetical protein
MEDAQMANDAQVRALEAAKRDLEAQLKAIKQVSLMRWSDEQAA